MPTYTQYMDPTDTGTGPSNIIWADCPWLQMLNDGSGYCFHDDFHVRGLTPGTLTAEIADQSGYYTFFGSAGATINPGAELGGTVVLTESDDNQVAIISTEAKPFQITQNGGQFWFECRVKPGTVTTLEQGFFIGLMDTTATSATVPLTATGTIADINCVGFHKPEANTPAFDPSCKADGVTAVEVNSDVGTLSTSSYIKLGMKYDPRDYKLSFYINGAKQATTKTIPNATGTDFPADVVMGPVCAILCGTDNDNVLTMDWWRFAQLRTA